MSLLHISLSTESDAPKLCVKASGLSSNLPPQRDWLPLSPPSRLPAPSAPASAMASLSVYPATVYPLLFWAHTTLGRP